jgi:hypothetical protein
MMRQRVKKQSGHWGALHTAQWHNTLSAVAWGSSSHRSDRTERLMPEGLHRLPMTGRAQTGIGRIWEGEERWATQDDVTTLGEAAFRGVLAVVRVAQCLPGPLVSADGVTPPWQGENKTPQRVGVRSPCGGTAVAWASCRNPRQPPSRHGRVGELVVLSEQRVVHSSAGDGVPLASWPAQPSTGAVTMGRAGRGGMVAASGTSHAVHGGKLQRPGDQCGYGGLLCLSPVTLDFLQVFWKSAAARGSRRLPTPQRGGVRACCRRPRFALLCSLLLRPFATSFPCCARGA